MTNVENILSQAAKIQAAARYARIVVHAGDGEYLADTLVQNGWEIPEQPARFLALEVVRDGIGDTTVVWAMNAETMPELLDELNQSSTERDDVEVFDLDKPADSESDNTDCQVIVIQEVIGWYEDNKLIRPTPPKTVWALATDGENGTDCTIFESELELYETLGHQISNDAQAKRVAELVAEGDLEALKDYVVDEIESDTTFSIATKRLGK